MTGPSGLVIIPSADLVAPTAAGVRSTCRTDHLLPHLPHEGWAASTKLCSPAQASTLR